MLKINKKRICSAFLSVMFPVSILLSSITVYAADQAVGNTYYVDSVEGNDNNRGDSPAAAWKTLDKVNSETFGPGDKILFKADGEWEGNLKPKGSGTGDAPVIIDAYGNGKKPKISANGLYEAAVTLENIEYWEVNNLEITNLGPEQAKSRFGVVIRAKDFGVMRHIYVRNLYVHDINGWLPKLDREEGCGIYFESRGTIESKFDDIRIEQNYLKDVDRNGIAQYYDFGYHRWDSDEQEPTEKSYRSENVVVRGNILENIGGDGIKIWGSDGALVERNVIRGAQMRSTSASAGIWPFDSNNTLIQFNEVSGLHGNLDGQAFDADFYTTNTIFQYNYSHDNDGGFMLLCSPGFAYSDGTVVRYNISQNDGSPGNSIFNFGGAATHTNIYNNVIYVSKEKSGYPVLRAGSWEGGSPSDARFANNIFYFEGDLAKFSNNPLPASFSFDHNVFYGKRLGDEPDDPYKITEDPGFVMPDGAGFGIDSAAAYKIRSNSVCIDKGAVINPGELGVKISHKDACLPFLNKNPGLDFFGNPVVAEESTPDIGAYEAAFDNFPVAGTETAPSIQSLTQISPGTVRLDFSGVENADYYGIEYGPVYGYGTNARVIKNVTGSSHTVPGLKETEYFFRMYAVTENGTGYYSKEKRITVNNTYVNENFEDTPATGWDVKSGSWDIASPQGGKTVLEDDFENGAGNWTPAFSESEWSIADHNGNKTYDVTLTGGDSVTGSMDWQDYSAETDITPNSYGEWGCAALLLRYTDSNNNYTVLMNETEIMLKKKVNGTQTTLDSEALPTPANTTRHIKAVIVGDQIDVYADGSRMLSANDGSFTAGKAGLSAWNCAASFDNVKITLAKEVLLRDDFENGAGNWTPGSSAPEWSIADHNGNKTYDVTLTGGDSVAGRSDWRDYEVEADITPREYAEWGCASLFLRYLDSKNYYLVLTTETDVILKKSVDGTQTQIQSAPFSTPVNTARHVKSVITGDQIDVFVDGSKMLSVTDGSIAGGRVALSAWNCAVSFDNVKIVGIYQDSFNKYYEQSDAAGGEVMIVQEAPEDYICEADLTPSYFGDNGYIGLDVRYNDFHNKYSVCTTGSSISINKTVSGEVSVLAEEAYLINPNETCRFMAVVSGTQIDLYVNGNLELTANDSTFPAGSVAMSMDRATGWFDNVRVTGISDAPESGEPILKVPSIDYGKKIITGIQELRVSTEAGKAPVLPAAVNVVYNDGTTGYAAVIWDIIDPAQYANASGTPFVVYGTVEGTAIRAVAKITAEPVPVDNTPVAGSERKRNQPVVAGSTVKLPKPLVKNGTAESAIEAEVINKALAAANPGKDGMRTVTVVVPAVNGISEYRQTAPASILTSAAADTKIIFAIGAVGLEVQGNTFSGMDIRTDHITLSVGKPDTGKAEPGTAGTASDKPAIEINAFAGDKRLSLNNRTAPVAVSLKYLPKTEENPEFLSVWRISEKGEAIPVPNAKYSESDGEMTFTAASFGKYSVVYAPKTFNDLGGHSWAKHSIEVLASKGIIGGTSETTFDPSARISRADFLQLLISASNLNADVTENFSDVNENAYYYNATGVAKKLGIVEGTGCGNFNPNADITRQDMFVMLAKAMKLSGKPVDGTGGGMAAFSDNNQVSGYARSSVNALVNAGIVNGEGGRLNPLDTAARAEAAVILYRAYMK